MSTAPTTSGSYDPKQVEPAIYKFWEQGDYFAARVNSDRPPYVIDIPLPNVTGALHLGHALNNTLQDTLIRYHRMRGYEALWMPGTDHAGIATQAVVERKLKEEQNVTRHELGRDGLVKKIWEWKEEYGGRILMQLRTMGFSCDWARTRFTLDEVCAKAVYEVFFQWFKAGLIYRGLRLVNWDAHLQTAVADDEVIYEKLKGHFWHFRYPILEGTGNGEQGTEERHAGTQARRHEGESEPRPQGSGHSETRPQGSGYSEPRPQGGRHSEPRPRGSGHSEPRPQGRGTAGPASGRSFRAMESVPDDIARAAIARATREDAQLGVDYMAIATTRPETMLGDTALCVHPDDPRYQHVIGKHVLLPLMNRAIPIIADGQLAKMEMGTGCVKVTPGHDPKDYQCGLRNKLPMVNILTNDGKINENGRGTGNREQGTGERHAGTEARRHEGAETFTAGEQGAEHRRPGGATESEPRPQGSGSSEARPQGRALLADDARVSGYDYVGLSKEKARKQVVEDLQALGLVEKIEDYETEVGHSDRSKTPIEPLLSEQWFVKMADLAEMAMEAVRDGRVMFYPERYAKTFLDWLGEKRDWCISRQLWWGHRIPVWTKRMSRREWGTWMAAEPAATVLVGSSDARICVQVETPDGQSFFLGGVPGDYEAALSLRDRTRADDKLTWRVCLRELNADADCIVNTQPVKVREWLERNGFSQDPDVLDTWFSSALWPFSTLGWPDNYGKGTGNREQGTEPASAPPCSPFPVPGSLRDLDYFYPTSVLVTSRDIITLWVARMVITGLYFQKRVPFQHVHVHPVIQDGHGRRMSKSAGNGVDPLDIIELYGTDALRYTMASMDTETQDARLPVKPLTLPDGRKINTSEKFELGRNFCNKIWQAATGFVLPNIAGERREGTEARRHEGEGTGNREQGAASHRHPGDVTAQNHDRKGAGLQNPDCEGGAGLAPLDVAALPIEDRWILSRLAKATTDIDSAFSRYEIAGVTSTIYSFFWNDFCDWYVELVKPRLYSKDGEQGTGNREQKDVSAARRMLAFILDQSLRLMHPVMPFISEALWAKLNAAAPRRGICSICDAEPALIRAAWPDADKPPRDLQVEREMAALQDVIRALRDALARINQARSTAKQPAIGKLPKAILRVDASIAVGLSQQHAVLERLGRCESVEVGTNVAKPAESSTTVLPGVEVYVPLHGLMDLAAEKKRLEKEQTELRGHLDRLAAKLGNEGFVAKAPATVIEQERGRLAEMQSRLATLERNIAELA